MLPQGGGGKPKTRGAAEETHGRAEKTQRARLGVFHLHGQVARVDLGGVGRFLERADSAADSPVRL